MKKKESQATTTQKRKVTRKRSKCKPLSPPLLDRRQKAFPQSIVLLSMLKKKILNSSRLLR